MISLTDKPLDAAEALRRFEQTNPAAGAIVTFSGKVRENAGAKTVTKLFLEHTPGLTEKGIAHIGDAACERWQVNEVQIIHRVGEIPAGETIVFVAAASAHRRDSFQAADFLMDYLKSEALFWKKEIYQDGSSSWIEPRMQDYHDKKRWISA